MTLLTVFLAGTVLTALAIYFSIHRPLGIHYSAIISVITEIRETLLIKTATIGIIFFFLIAAGAGLLTLVYTHRIAGPLYRIKQCTKAIAGGNLDIKVKLRHKDAATAFADSINEMTECYSNKVTALSSEIQHLHTAVKEFHKLVGENRDTNEAKDIISMTDKKIREILETLKI